MTGTHVALVADPAVYRAVAHHLAGAYPAGSGCPRSVAGPSEPRQSMTPPALNHRLTTLDATFLYTEKPVQPMHVGGSMLYEGHLSLDVLVRALECRLHLLPRYRQKVVFPPFATAHPTWEDDPAFDIRHHVTQVTLPRRATIGPCPRWAGGLRGHARPRSPAVEAHRGARPRRRQHRGDLEGPPRHDRRGLRRRSHDGAPRSQARRGTARAPGHAVAAAAAPGPADAAAERGPRSRHRGGPVGHRRRLPPAPADRARDADPAARGGGGDHRSESTATGASYALDAPSRRSGASGGPSSRSASSGGRSRCSEGR